jgi:glycosyltransferase involved in cell wall biosynthesis
MPEPTAATVLSSPAAAGAAPRVAALIPAYREARHIAAVVRATRPQVDEVLVVDDGSPDDTAAQAEAAGARVIRHAANRGKGAAIKTGLAALRERGARFIVLLDGDGQHASDEIPRFVAAAEAGAELVVGNRLGDTRDMPLVRRWVNRFMSWRISRACGTPIPDTQCGFRLLARDAVPALLGETDRFDFETEMLVLAARAGHRIASVPIRTIYGEEKSKISPVRDALRFFRLMRRLTGRWL